MTPKLSPRTTALVESIFTLEDVEEACQSLEQDCGNNLPGCSDSDEYRLERLRFAAIKVSQGNMSKLHEAIHEAQIDWRDLLMEAGFGYDVNEHETWAEKALGL